MELFRTVFLGGKPGDSTVKEQVSKLWFDMAGSPFPDQIPALVKAFGSDRLLYGRLPGLRSQPAAAGAVRGTKPGRIRALRRRADRGDRRRLRRRIPAPTPVSSTRNVRLEVPPVSGTRPATQAPGRHSPARALTRRRSCASRFSSAGLAAIGPHLLVGTSASSAKQLSSSI
jgi:hypothetical protein